MEHLAKWKKQLDRIDAPENQAALLRDVADAYLESELANCRDHRLRALVLLHHLAALFV